MQFNKCLALLLVCPAFLFGIDPGIGSLSKVNGFDSTFFSDKSGHPFLHIQYQDAISERPKIGFLKFRNAEKNPGFVSIFHGFFPRNRFLTFSWRRYYNFLIFCMMIETNTVQHLAKVFGFRK